MNPFLNEHSDPWSSDFVDIESINADVTDAIVGHINEARAESLDAPRPRAALMLLRGPAGSGKTHLFARLRRKCGARAAFVLIRPEIGVEPNVRLLLAKIIEALGRPAFGRAERQLDVIVGATLGVLRGLRSFPTTTLNELRQQPREDIDEAIEGVLEEIESAYPDVSLNYLEQLLRTPFANSGGRRGAMTWLAGNVPTDAQLRKLGLSAALADAELMPALRGLSLICALHGPLVLVLDQLENLYDSDDRSDRINAYGNLVAELYDSVPGLVMVQMALDSEWNRRIHRQLSLPQRSRLESESHMIELPNADQRVELVRAWSAKLPGVERESFPFSDDQLKVWREQPGVTPRMLMIACRRVLQSEGRDIVIPSGESEPSAPDGSRVAATSDPQDSERGAGQGDDDDTPAEALAERLGELWDHALSVARNSIREFQNDESLVPPQRIVGGLVCLGRILGASPVVVRLPVNPTVRFNVEGAIVDIGVFQDRAAGPMGKVLIRATKAAVTQPVLILRDSALAIPLSWAGVEQRRREFEASAHGQWLDAGQDVLTSLLALHDFEAMSRSGDLSASDGAAINEQQVREWLAHGLEWRTWRTTKCILAVLHGQRPENGDEQSECVNAGGSHPAPDEAELVEGGAHPGRDGKHEDAKPPPEQSLEGQGPKRTDGNLALEALRRLHLASVERLVRVVRASDRSVSRAAVLEMLGRAADEVDWLGASLVCLKEVRP